LHFTCSGVYRLFLHSLYPSLILSQYSELQNFIRSVYGKTKKDILTDVLLFGLLTDLVELQGHSALAVSSRVLVQNALSDSLIDLLDRDLVSAIGLGAIAFSGSRLELLDGSLQIGLRSLIARVADLTDEDTLLGRLDIRQTKHLLLAFLGAVS